MQYDVLWANQFVKNRNYVFNELHWLNQDIELIIKIEGLFLLPRVFSIVRKKIVF